MHADNSPIEKLLDQLAPMIGKTNGTAGIVEAQEIQSLSRTFVDERADHEGNGQRGGGTATK